MLKIKTKFAILLVIIIFLGFENAEGICLAQNSAKTMVCYYPNLAIYNTPPANMKVSSLDP